MPEFAAQRRMMVDNQLRTFDVTQAAVLAAVEAVPRELFVRPADRAIAYSDAALAVGEGGGRVLPAPMVFARLLQTAEIRPDDVVLDVGCGTGYSSAVLARLAASVVALESEAALADAATRTLAGLGIANVAVVAGALDAGFAKEGPYDVIVVEGSFEREPEALLAQLRDGGRLVGVRGTGRAGRAMLYRRSGDSIGARAVFDCAAPALAEFREAPAFVF